MMVVSFLCAIATGRMEQLSEAVMDGASGAVNLVLLTTGAMCAWTGLMKIGDAGGLTALLAKVFYPLTRRMFPDWKRQVPQQKRFV